MEFLADLFEWFSDPINWSGTEGIPARLWEHIQYSLIATFIGALIALPLALVLGHTGRGGLLAINLTNTGRAIPSLGIIILVYIAAGLNLLPVYAALVALAIPPIVTNTYVGIRSVDRGVRESAEGMGLTGFQVLKDVEIPVAMPLIMAGIRTSAVQVVATATLAAYIGFGGLGRFLIDGLATFDLAQMTGGAVLVAVLSLAVEVAFGALQNALVSEGVTPRKRTATIRAKLGSTTA
ncbi:MAG: ABC transporter permease [Actinobacteria bacterium]|nr:ABC transporter permease [Actinomycetota bacterium]